MGNLTWAEVGPKMVHCAVPEKNPYPPHGRSLEIPRGRGVLKVKILEAKYKAKLEFLGRQGVQNKKPSVEGVWIFSGKAQFIADIDGCFTIKCTF